METKEILEKVRCGEISIEEAERHFKKQPYEEMGFAKLDVHREVRTGFPEVIYCAGKADDYLVSIYQKMYETGDVSGYRHPQNIHSTGHCQDQSGFPDI